MIRLILTPDKDTITIKLPTHYVGKEVEIIAFATEEVLSAEEKTLGKDWLTSEEDNAWKDL